MENNNVLTDEIIQSLGFVKKEKYPGNSKNDVYDLKYNVDGYEIRNKIFNINFLITQHLFNKEKYIIEMLGDDMGNSRDINNADDIIQFIIKNTEKMTIRNTKQKTLDFLKP